MNTFHYMPFPHQSCVLCGMSSDDINASVRDAIFLYPESYANSELVKRHDRVVCRPDMIAVLEVMTE